MLGGEVFKLAIGFLGTGLVENEILEEFEIFLRQALVG